MKSVEVNSSSSSSSSNELTSLILNQLSDTNGRQSTKNSSSSESTNEIASTRVPRTSTNASRRSINGRLGGISSCDSSTAYFESKGKQKQGEKHPVHFDSSSPTSASLCLLSHQQQGQFKPKSHVSQGLFSTNYASSFYPFSSPSIASAISTNTNSLSLISPWLSQCNNTPAHVTPSTLTSLANPYSLLAAFYHQQQQHQHQHHNQQQHLTPDTVTSGKSSVDINYRHLPFPSWLGQRVIGSNNSGNSSLGDCSQLPSIAMGQFFRRPIFTMSLNGSSNHNGSILSNLNNNLSKTSNNSSSSGGGGGSGNSTSAISSHCNGNNINNSNNNNNNNNSNSGNNNSKSYNSSPSLIDKSGTSMTSQSERPMCPLPSNSIIDGNSKNTRISSSPMDTLGPLLLSHESIGSNVTSGPVASGGTSIYSSPLEASLFSAAKLHVYLQQQHHHQQQQQRQQRALNVISHQFKYPSFTSDTSGSGNSSL